MFRIVRFTQVLLNEYGEYMSKILSGGGVALLALVAAASAQGQIIVSEVSPWSSGNSPYAADWFEVTNLGSSSVDLSGWKFDDNSNSFASSVSLLGVASIPAGGSAIFMETTNAATSLNAFANAWFNGVVPAGFLFGSYSGSGVGLSTGGDAVNIYNSTGVLQANVVFGVSTTGRTFDNAAGLNNATISLLSTVGVNGAFSGITSGEVGSPGVIPAPGVAALGVAGLVVAGRRRRAGR